MQLLSLGPFVSNSVSSSHRAGASERVFPFEATDIGDGPKISLMRRHWDWHAECA